MNFNYLLSVALGAALGGVARYLISFAIQPVPDRFPWATFIANLTGCLLIGMLVPWLTKSDSSMQTRLFLTTGFCGGFTTFSSFSAETFLLLQRGHLPMALTYVLSSLIGGVLLTWIGYRMIV